MDFPSVVKLVREKMGVSQEELARALNVSFASVNRWENGKNHPNQLALSVFCNYCEQQGISVKELLQK